MSDNYQAVYDAVRSKLSNCDVGSAIEQAINQMNCGHYVQMAMYSFQEAASMQMSPHVLMRPSISIDGDCWCALYGDNLQDGVAGFGKSPRDAMADFDKNWEEILEKQSTKGREE